MQRIVLCRRMLLPAMLALAVVAAPTASARLIALDPPGEKDFILDKAGLISTEDAARIKETCGKLLFDKAIPIVTVTIESMAQYAAQDMRIETFATLLFDQWGIGYEEVAGKKFNRGMLLLVSAGDRKARIELGADWAHDFDVTAQQIMDQQIIPRFKQGEFSAGIVAGVESLDKMSRGLELPRAPVSPLQILLVVGGIALGIFTVVSLIRSGTGGWGWLLWAAIFGIVGYLLYSFLTSSARGHSGLGGGFSGGSFGGGFSGGGGATGSW
ncbi:MAG: TPM domain-containing protein [Candidatus Hydrogenedentes bacterium]|nr:TPM domain-containing protein [Candidatus Hydrogenedentota bacterium]